MPDSTTTHRAAAVTDLDGVRIVTPEDCPAGRQVCARGVDRPCPRYQGFVVWGDMGSFATCRDAPAPKTRLATPPACTTCAVTMERRAAAHLRWLDAPQEAYACPGCGEVRLFELRTTDPAPRRAPDAI